MRVRVRASVRVRVRVWDRVRIELELGVGLGVGPWGRVGPTCASTAERQLRYVVTWLGLGLG